MEFRKAAQEDIEKLVAVRVDFLAECGHAATPEERDVLKRMNVEYFSESLADGSLAVWLAEEDGKIVATGSVSFCRRPPNKYVPSGKCAYIGSIFTYPAYRKQGIGTKIFELMVREAKAAGCGRIELHATEMGRPLYERFGFEPSASYMTIFVE